MLTTLQVDTHDVRGAGGYEASAGSNPELLGRGGFDLEHHRGLRGVPHRDHVHIVADTVDAVQREYVSRTTRKNES